MILGSIGSKSIDYDYGTGECATPNLVDGRTTSIERRKGLLDGNHIDRQLRQYTLQDRLVDLRSMWWRFDSVVRYDIAAVEVSRFPSQGSYKVVSLTHDSPGQTGDTLCSI